MYFGQTLEACDYMVVIHKVKNAKNQHPKILQYKYIDYENVHHLIIMSSSWF